MCIIVSTLVKQHVPPVEHELPVVEQLAHPKPERTTNPGQAICKLYHIRLRVECTLCCNLQSGVRTNAVLVIGLYELLDPTT
jgi:hypothetical protein